jgi:hypothetical protein
MCGILFYPLSVSIFYLIEYFSETINFSFITTAWYVAFLCIAVGIAYLFFISSFYFYQITSFIGEYDQFTISNRKVRAQNYCRILWYNFVLTIPVYLTIWIILNPCKSQMYPFFITDLIISLAFFASLRFASNPTYGGLNLFKTEKYIPLLPEQENAIKKFKENIISLYFSLIEITVFYLIIRALLWIITQTTNNIDIISIFIQHLITNPIQTIREIFLDIISTFLPIIPTNQILELIIAYFIALGVSTAIVELLLICWKPIKLTKS